jgi:peptidyl-prolyl cis-trans isomerase D
LIVELLQKNFAKKLGLSVSDNEVRSAIAELLGGAVQNYEMLLNRVGMTAPAFEKQIGQEILQKRVSGIVSDAAIATKQDIRAGLSKELTMYSVKYALVGADKVREGLPKPTDAELDAFFQANQSRFERPRRVEYTYAVLPPQLVADQIPVEEAAVNEYYTLHEDKFKLPDQVVYRHILFSLPEGASPEQIGDIRVRAELVRSKLKEGGVFSSMARVYSEDEKTRDAGGLVGVVKKGDLSPEFDAVVFKKEQDYAPQVVETTGAIEVVQVDEERPGERRSLEDVRSEIEAALRKADVPAFLADKAEAIYAEWTDSQKPLSEIAAKFNLSEKRSGGYVSSGTDPEADLSGLTERLLGFSEEKKHLVEIGSSFVLAEISGLREKDVAPLAEIQTDVSKAFEDERALKRAREKASEIIKGIKSGESFDRIVKASGLEVQEAEGISVDKLASTQLGKAADIERLFAAATTNTVFDEPLALGDKFGVVQVTNLQLPTEEEISNQTPGRLREWQEHEGDILESSFLNYLKAHSDKDVNASVIAAGE